MMWSRRSRPRAQVRDRRATHRLNPGAQRDTKEPLVDNERGLGYRLRGYAEGAQD